MERRSRASLTVEILEEDVEWSQQELCRVCEISVEQLTEFVEHGLVDPAGQAAPDWRFQGSSLHRIRFATSIKRDLGVNTAGAALALDLLREIEDLRRRLRHREAQQQRDA